MARLRWLAAAVALFATLQASSASHYRYGNSNWKPVNPNDYLRTSSIPVRMTVMMGWRRSAFGVTAVGQNTFSVSINFGSGGNANFGSFVVTVVDMTGDWFAASKQITYTFPGQGPYTGLWTSCCRIGCTPIGCLRNNAHGRMRLWYTVDLRRFGGNTWKNTSPVVSQVPIQTIVMGQNNVWSVGASDDDVDPLTYRIGTVAEITGSSGQQPTGATSGAAASTWNVGANTGTATIGAANVESIYYSGMIVISDGYCLIAVDFLMYTVRPIKYCQCTPRCTTCSNNGNCAGSCTCGNNAPPVFIPPSPWISGGLPTCFVPGGSVAINQFALAAHDPIDTCDNVIVTSGDLPVGANLIPRSTAHSNSRTYDFLWVPTTAQAGTHRVSFVARDSANGIGQPESVELFVPAVSGSAAAPVVTSWSPNTGDEIAASTITFLGSNFLRGPNLMCRFSYDGAPASASRLVRPVWLNSGKILCVMPKESDLGGSRSGSRTAKVEVSNYASCNLWVTMTPRFTYTNACPPGTSGPTCSACGLGKYGAGGGAASNGCTDCPAGKYGNVPGLVSPQCSGDCLAGYYCLAGSSSPTSVKCPAGRYGDSPGVGNSGCTGQCDAGYYCPGALVNTNARTFPCPPGRFGAPGEIDNQCAGICQAGYLCPAGSSSSQQQPCGAVTRFCTAGGSAPFDVLDGWYSTGNTETTRTAQQECEPGFYCSGGRRFQCPAGRYGDDRGETRSTCKDVCDGGFTCPVGSSTPTAVECGASTALPATVFCPPGSITPQNVRTGYYSTPDSPGSDPKQRSGEAPCSATEFCVNGLRFQRVEWTVPPSMPASQPLCVGGGSTGSGSMTWEENAVVPPFRVHANTYETQVRGDVNYVTAVVTATGVGCPVAPNAVLVDTSSPRSSDVTLTPGWMPDYEACDEYTVTVTVNTPNGFSSVCTIDVAIVDKNDPPVLCDTSILPGSGCIATLASRLPYQLEENPAKASAVGLPMHDEVATDQDIGDEVAYNITAISSNTGTPTSDLFSWFAIGSCSGQLSIATTIPSNFNFEALRTAAGGATPRFTLTININDNAIPVPSMVDATVTVDLVNINEAPTFTDPPGFTFWVEENTAPGTGVSPNPGPGTFDPDSDAPSPASWTTLTYAIAEQEGNRFQIGGSSGQLSVAVGATMNFEALDSPLVALELRVSDGAALSAEQGFFAEVLDVNDAPVVEDDTLFMDENVPTGTVVGYITALDDEYDAANLGRTVMSWGIDSVHFGGRPASIGGHSSPFAIRPATGGGREPTITGEVYTTAAIDFETLATYVLTVRVTDNGLDMSGRPTNPATYPARDDTADITIKVRNVNEAPFFLPASLSLTTDEERATPFVISDPGALMADDPDKGPGGEPLTIPDPANPTGPQIPNVYAFSPPTFSFVSGAGSLFDVDRDSGNVTVLGRLNFEAQNSYTLTARTSDGALSEDATVTITITDVNEAPVLASGVSLTLPENSGNGVTLTGPAVSGTDVDAGDTRTFSIPAGSEADGLLAIDPVSGVVTTDATAPDTEGDDATFNFEGGGATFSFTVRVTDVGGLWHEDFVTVALTNVNEPPFFTPSVQIGSVVDNEAAGVLAATLTGDDPDIVKSGDSISFSVGSLLPESNYGGAGGTACAAMFNPATDVSSATGAVTLGNAPSSLAGATAVEWCNYTMTVTDAPGGLTQVDTGAVFALAIQDQNLPVTIPATQSFNLDENSLFGTAGVIQVPDLGAADGDANEQLTYTLASVTSVTPLGVDVSGIFKVVPGNTCTVEAGGTECAGALALTGNLDFETVQSISMVVTAFDTNSIARRSAQSLVTINVQDVNEAPDVDGPLMLVNGDSLLAMTVAETTPTSGAVGTAQFTDVDAGGSHTWSSPAMDADGFFAINPTTGAVTVAATGAARTAALDFETVPGSKYEYAITVTDQGTLASTKTLTIFLVNENEAPTVTVQPLAPFSSTLAPNGVATLTEGAVTGGIEVVTLEAFDVDGINAESNWGVMNYTILSGNSDNIWTVTTAVAGATSTNDGALRLAAGSLDYELFPTFSLVIRAEDGGGLFVDVTVDITVTNVNDVLVSTMTGAWDALDTAGGDVLTLDGANLGLFYPQILPSTDAVITLRAVGNTRPPNVPAFREFPDAGVWNVTYMAPCTQTVDNTQITCTMPAGAANDISFWLHVSLPAPASVEDVIALPAWTGSYRQPNVTGISGTHVDMVTPGSESVTLTGTQFPPMGGRVWVSYGPPEALHRFHTTGCTVTVANTAVTCMTAPGVGAGLAWTLASSGQWSATWGGSSKYANPAITGVSVVTRTRPASEVFGDFPVASEPQWLNPAGGEVIEITGTNFGEELSTPPAAGLPAIWPMVTYSRLMSDPTTVVSTAPGALTPAAPAPGGAFTEGGNYVYAATGCVVTVAHTTMRCTTARGAGAALSPQVSVAGQSSPLIVGGAVSLHYRPPYVTDVKGDGTQLAAARTEGGETITMTADWLPADGDERIVVTYGPAPAWNTFTAQGCRVPTGSGSSTIQCATAVGTGKDWLFSITVADQLVSNPMGRIGTNHSYHPPVVAAYDGPGASDAWTQGGQGVNISGRHFGPLGSGNIQSVVYFDAEQQLQCEIDPAVACPPRFTAAPGSCAVTVAHRQITCTTGEGAGEGLRWELLIGGLLSTEVSTSYLPPSITDLSLPATGSFAAAAGAARAHPIGGERITISGWNFGPDLAYQGANVPLVPTSRPFLDWVRYSPFTSLGATTDTFYEARDCVVEDHETVSCTTLAGAGGPFYWFASVRGQVNEHTVPHPTFAFRDIAITAVEAGSQQVDGVAVPTARFERGGTPVASTADDGELVRLVGQGFGVQDGFATHTVIFGDKELAPTNKWYDPNLDAEVIEFRKPGGHGGGHALALRVDSLQPQPIWSAQLVWNYAAPDFDITTGQESVSIEKIIPGVLNITLRSPAGAFCQPPAGFEGGYPAGAGPPALPVDMATDSPLALCGQLILDHTPPPGPDRDAYYVGNFFPTYNQPAPSMGYIIPRERILSWNPHEVRFWTAAAPLNTLTVMIGNQADASIYRDVAPSLRQADCDLVDPSVVQLESNPTLPFNITGANLCDRDVVVKFRFEAGSFLTGGAVSERDCISTGPQFSRPPVADAVGTDPVSGDPICMTQCIPPLGQNKATVVVIAGGLETLNGCPVAYDEPSVTSVTMDVDDAGDAIGSPRTVTRAYTPALDGATTQYYFEVTGTNGTLLGPDIMQLTATVPTAGGVITLHGNNFGEDGVLAGGFLCAGVDGGSFAALRNMNEPTGPLAGEVCLKGLPQNAARAHDHEMHELYVPGGNAAMRRVLTLGVGNLPARSTYLLLRYESPVVAAAGFMTAASGADVPTQGGVVEITGKNFGDDDSVLVVTLQAPGLPVVTCANVRLTAAHRSIECDMPPGVGESFDVIVTAAGVASRFDVPTSPVTVSYQAPTITSVWPTVWPTRAGTLVTIMGTNFLPAGLMPGALEAVVLVPSGPEDLAVMVPDPFAVGHAEGALLNRGSTWVSHNSTMIQFRAPHLQGRPRALRLFVGNVMVTAIGGTGVVVSTMPPVVTRQEPATGPTKGYVVKLVGDNFGRREYTHATAVNTFALPAAAFNYPVRAGSDPSRDHVPSLTALTMKTAVSNGVAVVTSVDGAEVPERPCRDLAPIWDSFLRDNWATHYLHQENAFDTGPPNQPASPYEHEYYFCKIDAGFGADNPMQVSVDDTNTVATTFSFNAPFVRSTRPNTPDAAGLRNWHIQGADFGSPDLPVPLGVTVNGIPCLGLSLNTSNLIECDTQRDVVGPKLVSVSAGGYENITYPNVTLLGSATIASTGAGHPNAAATLIARALSSHGDFVVQDHAGKAIGPSGVAALFGAAEGSQRSVGVEPLGEHGVRVLLLERNGEAVNVNVNSLRRRVSSNPGRALQADEDDDPQGAIGLEEDMYTTDDKAVGRINSVFKVQYHCPSGYWGQLGEYCQECLEGAVCDSLCLASSGSICTDFSEPYSQEGWYALGTNVGDPECERSTRPYPYNTTCYDLVPCEPAESCTGNNTCGTGYDGDRCAFCAQGYFRVAGLCTECPDLAWLFILLFVVMIMAICVGGYVLNRHKIHLAFISIGVDYFQILGMFATARVAWPQFLRDLYRVLSIFQVNLDITAPECALPNVNYANKWFAIQLLPVCIGGFLLLIYGSKSFWDRFVMRLEAKHRGKHTPTLVAMGQLMMYYLYLLLTKTTFDAFNCQPTEPSDGKLYLEIEFVECYTPAHNQIFIPALVATLPLYTIAYPVWVYWHLRRNKDKIKTDQLLRAMGIGESKLTNPHYEFRLMFHKLYYHFKPGKWHWLLVIIFRKFCIALTGLLFRRTPSFQMAVAFLVLFFSFSVQVRNNPFMSMSERKGIILHHKAKAAEGNKKHQAIAAAYSTAVRNANDRQKARALNMDKVMATSTNSQADYLFDYNTMEAVLLSCGVFVCLSGVMFQTGDLDSPIYQTQREILTVLVAIVIFASLIYFFTVFFIEVRTACGGGACASKSKGKGKGGKPTGKDLKKAKAIDMEMESSSAMQMNPMAMRATLKAEMARLDEVLRSDGVPTPAQWEMVRMQAQEIQTSLQGLMWEADGLRDEQAEARRTSQAARGKNGKRRSILERALGLNKQDESATPDMAGVMAVAMKAAALEGVPEGGVPTREVAPGELSDTAVAGGSNPMMARSKSFAIKAGAKPAGGVSAANPMALIVEEGDDAELLGGAAAGVAAGALVGGAAESKAPARKKKARRASVAVLAAKKGDGDATWGPWTRCTNADALVWYHNSETGASTYDMPSGFDAEGVLMWDAEYTAAAAEEVTGLGSEAIAEAAEEVEEEDGAESAVAAPGAVAANPLAGDAAV